MSRDKVRSLVIEKLVCERMGRAEFDLRDGKVFLTQAIGAK